MKYPKYQRQGTHDLRTEKKQHLKFINLNKEVVWEHIVK